MDQCRCQPNHPMCQGPSQMQPSYSCPSIPCLHLECNPICKIIVKTLSYYQHVANEPVPEDTCLKGSVEGEKMTNLLWFSLTVGESFYNSTNAKCWRWACPSFANSLFPPPWSQVSISGLGFHSLYPPKTCCDQAARLRHIPAISHMFSWIIPHYTSIYICPCTPNRITYRMFRARTCASVIILPTLPKYVYVVKIQTEELS